MTEICQNHLPVRPWASENTRRLPGLNPIEPGEWIQVDDAYAAQMAHKSAILAREGEAVLRMTPGAGPACWPITG